MSNALVPELAVSDWQTSRRFYCQTIGFSCLYERPEEGFSYLALDAAELMIDQIDLGRTFDDGHAPEGRPFGRGLNLQIRVPAIRPLLAALEAAGWPLLLPPEDRWYRRDDGALGNRQFVVADPDGYLLRFYEDLGWRKI
ncbi:bleomycin resistance protein [Solirhodobacter olei]|uniref:bleomycin resistance protein n=1 Tax=Solirhodobacter olei TaxID=2493082 RepID=UPI000FDB4F16|nr:VOC family protein [Solirhodobacter olei]